MNTPQKKWNIADPIPASIQQELTSFHPVLRQILYNRGYRTAQEANRFLDAQLPKEESISLQGIPEAVRLIQTALQEQKTIAVYGDYDVDGITGTALLTTALRKLGAESVIPYIPDRVEEGYGLNTSAIETLREQGAQLLISVDCGIRAIEEVQRGKELGMEIIITDHHKPGDITPPADAIINPKQKEDPYPEKTLAGVGVAYKLLVGLFKEYPDLDPEPYLDLVAIGTVADLVPLKGENRALVRKGLEKLNPPLRQGLRSLMAVADLISQKDQRVLNITAEDIGFRLGPRINAAGRIDHGRKALDLLLEENRQQAGLYAQELDILNRNRQKLTRDIFKKAQQVALITDEVPPVLFAFHSDFQQGVVGLAASSLLESYYRPAIVGQKKDQTTTASCRSIPEFNIIEALDQCQDLLLQHGGHAAAAGFTIQNEHIPTFQERMLTLAREQFADLDLKPVLHIDAQVRLEDLNANLLQDLKRLQPTGFGNPQPKFMSSQVQVKRKKRVGRKERHLKLKVSDGKLTFDAIAFQQGAWYDHLPRTIDIAYTFEENEFRGRKTLQLNIKDIKVPSIHPQN
jgi:single-stranded-DNA-specific exonuclease